MDVAVAVLTGWLLLSFATREQQHPVYSGSHEAAESWMDAYKEKRRLSSASLLRKRYLVPSK